MTLAKQLRDGTLDDPAGRVRRSTSRLEPALAAAFALAAREVRDRHTLEVLAGLLELGDLEGALAAVEEAAARMGTAASAAVIVAADEAAEFLSGFLITSVGFDRVNQGAVDALRHN